jgi:hypothetical protein
MILHINTNSVLERWHEINQRWDDTRDALAHKLGKHPEELVVSKGIPSFTS